MDDYSTLKQDADNLIIVDDSSKVDSIHINSIKGEKETIYSLSPFRQSSLISNFNITSNLKKTYEKISQNRISILTCAHEDILQQVYQETALKFANQGCIIQEVIFDSSFNSKNPLIELIDDIESSKEEELEESETVFFILDDSSPYSNDVSHFIQKLNLVKIIAKVLQERVSEMNIRLVCLTQIDKEFSTPFPQISFPCIKPFLEYHNQSEIINQILQGQKENVLPKKESDMILFLCDIIDQKDFRILLKKGSYKSELNFTDLVSENHIHSEILFVAAFFTPIEFKHFEKILSSVIEYNRNNSDETIRQFWGWDKDSTIRRCGLNIKQQNKKQFIRFTQSQDLTLTRKFLLTETPAFSMRIIESLLASKNFLFSSKLHWQTLAKIYQLTHLAENYIEHQSLLFNYFRELGKVLPKQNNNLNEQNAALIRFSNLIIYQCNHQNNDTYTFLDKISSSGNSIVMLYLLEYIRKYSDINILLYLKNGLSHNNIKIRTLIFQHIIHLTTVENDFALTVFKEVPSWLPQKSKEVKDFNFREKCALGIIFFSNESLIHRKEKQLQFLLSSINKEEIGNYLSGIISGILNPNLTEIVHKSFSSDVKNIEVSKIKILNTWNQYLYTFRNNDAVDSFYSFIKESIGDREQRIEFKKSIRILDQEFHEKILNCSSINEHEAIQNDIKIFRKLSKLLQS